MEESWRSILIWLQIIEILLTMQWRKNEVENVGCAFLTFCDIWFTC